MRYRVFRYPLRILGISALAAFALSVAACNNNQGGFSGSVGNTPDGPPLTTYKITGTPGTPFTATVSNARSSWTLQGNVPLSMVICNNILPAEIIATKTSSDNNLLSIQIINGNNVRGAASTTTPFQPVSLQTGGKLLEISPPANPDLRIFDSGPTKARYQALIEDSKNGFVVDERAPTLIFFDTPDGKVDGQFFPVNRDFGTFNLDMTLDGSVVATVDAGPSATIREP
jgi:hypothetical protein